MLKQIPSSAISWLTKFFNLAIKNGAVPEAWSHFKVFFTRKLRPDKFRPIALASTEMKILDGVITDRLQWCVESNNLLPHFLDLGETIKIML